VAAPLTFEEAARRWHAERIAPRYRASAPVVWRYIERDCKALFPRRLDAITRRHIAALVEAKKADGQNAAGKLLRLLRKMFRWAAAHELVEANPMDSLHAGDLEIGKLTRAIDSRPTSSCARSEPAGAARPDAPVRAPGRVPRGRGEGGAARADQRGRLDARSDEEREDARAAAEQDGRGAALERLGGPVARGALSAAQPQRPWVEASRPAADGRDAHAPAGSPATIDAILNHTPPSFTGPTSCRT
jgi:hypothetical protein